MPRSFLVRSKSRVSQSASPCDAQRSIGVPGTRATFHRCSSVRERNDCKSEVKDVRVVGKLDDFESDCNIDVEFMKSEVCVRISDVTRIPALILTSRDCHQDDVINGCGYATNKDEIADQILKPATIDRVTNTSSSQPLNEMRAKMKTAAVATLSSRVASTPPSTIATFSPVTSITSNAPTGAEKRGIWSPVADLEGKAARGRSSVERRAPVQVSAAAVCVVAPLRQASCALPATDEVQPQENSRDCLKNPFNASPRLIGQHPSQSISYSHFPLITHPSYPTCPFLNPLPSPTFVHSKFLKGHSSQKKKPAEENLDSPSLHRAQPLQIDLTAIHQHVPKDTSPSWGQEFHSRKSGFFSHRSKFPRRWGSSMPLGVKTPDSPPVVVNKISTDDASPQSTSGCSSGASDDFDLGSYRCACRTSRLLRAFDVAEQRCFQNEKLHSQYSKLDRAFLDKNLLGSRRTLVDNFQCVEKLDNTIGSGFEKAYRIATVRSAFPDNTLPSLNGNVEVLDHFACDDNFKIGIAPSPKICGHCHDTVFKDSKCSKYFPKEIVSDARDHEYFMNRIRADSESHGQKGAGLRDYTNFTNKIISNCTCTYFGNFKNKISAQCTNYQNFESKINADSNEYNNKVTADSRNHENFRDRTTADSKRCNESIRKPITSSKRCKGFQEGITVGYTYDTFFVSDGRARRGRPSLPEGSGAGTGAADASPVLQGAAQRVSQRFKCSECGKNYATSSNLSRHKQTHRSLESQQAKHCPHCRKVYVSMPALSMHILTHDLKYRCTVCSKAFSRPWLLQGHLRSHSGEKPYGCTHCGRAFADRSNLRAHMQTHSACKTYACVRCGRMFALKAYLNKHTESACLGDLNKT